MTFFWQSMRNYDSSTWKYEPVLVDGPDVPPVSLAECKLHLRVDGTDDDSLIQIYLDAAIAHLDGAGGWLGRSIVAQTWSQQFDAFARDLYLGLAPVTSISSVKYLDAASTEQTVDPANYQLLDETSAPVVRFDENYSFPSVQTDLPTVTVTFVSGYGDASDVPAAIKVGILLMVGDMYQNREAKVSSGLIENTAARMLLDPYRTRWIA